MTPSLSSISASFTKAGRGCVLDAHGKPPDIVKTAPRVKGFEEVYRLDMTRKWPIGDADGSPSSRDQRINYELLEETLSAQFNATVPTPAIIKERKTRNENGNENERGKENLLAKITRTGRGIAKKTKRKRKNRMRMITTLTTTKRIFKQERSWWYIKAA